MGTLIIFYCSAIPRIVIVYYLPSSE